MSKVWNFLERDEKDPYKRGMKFEKVFVKKYLESHYLFSKIYKTVLLWEEWDERPFKTDIGIDLVCIGYDNKITAVQAKAYNPKATISKPDIDSFITASNSNLFSNRLLIGTTNKIGKNAKAIINNEKRIPFQSHLLSDLEESNFIEICKSNKKLKEKEVKLSPYPHQIEAINKGNEHFNKQNYGQLIMACGSGKTLTSFWIAKKQNSKKVLFLAPSISLLAQTLEVWLKNSENNDLNFFVVCSDNTAGKVADFEYTSDFDFPSSTNSKKISEFINLNKQFVIFSTYQSSKTVLKEAKRNNINFDITICDEAHRLTGAKNNEYGSVLKTNFPTNKKLFMTATPRIISYGIKKAAEGREIDLISMDDEEIFGKVIYELNFGEAIEKKLLADYKIIVTGISNQDINKKEFIKVDQKTVDINTYAKAYSLKKVLKKYKLNKAITFHSYVESASKFSELLKSLNLNSNFISGYHSIRERKQLVKQLEEKSEEIEILTNARVLSEGIDLPELDCIAFIDPKSSVIDIVQAVGRAIRASKDRKKVGYIVIPIYLDDDKGFETVYKTIIAMRSHDARMAEQLDDFRIQIGSGLKLSKSKISNFIIDIPSYVDKNFKLDFTTKVIDASSETWYFWYGLLKKYTEENGHAVVPQNHFQEGFALGNWCSVQRRKYKKNQLNNKKVDLLNSLDGWVWDHNEIHFNNGVENLKKYYKSHGDWNIPYNYVSPDGFKLGQWVKNYRGRKENLSIEKFKIFEEIGFAWKSETFYEIKWKKNLKELQNFYQKFGHLNIPHDYLTEEGTKLFNIATVIRSSGNQGKLNKSQLEALKKINFIWDREKALVQTNLNNLRVFVEKYGHTSVPRDYEVQSGSNLSNWTGNIRRGKIKIDKETRKSLDLLNFEWSLEGTPKNIRRQKEVFNKGYKQLEKYYKKEKTALVNTYFIDQDNFNLGSWVSLQRNKYRDQRMIPEHIELLENMEGWNWYTKNDSFENGFKQLKKYYKKNNNLITTLPREDDDNFRLSTWASRQRRKYRSGKMEPERVKRFEELKGWEWNPSGINQFTK